MSMLEKIGFFKRRLECKELADKFDAVNRAQAVIEFDLAGTILYANENFLQVMGYSAHEVIGKHHSIFVDEAYRQSGEYRRFWDDLARGQHFISEFERRGKNGKTIWIQGSYNPLLDKNGKPYKVVKFATDISKNRLQAQYARALQSCQANVMLADNDCNIIYMNDTVKAMLQKNEAGLKKDLPNFSVERLIGTCVDDFHKDPKHQRGILNKLTTPYKTELKVGGLVFGLIATPWLDETGKRIGTLVEWDDRTERVALQQQEKRLAQENARVKEALDNVTANVMIADVDANIIYLNKAVMGMMRTAEKDIRTQIPGFDVNKLLGANIDVFHKNPSHQRNILKDLRGTYNGNAEAGGRIFTVIANPVFQDGERVGTVVEWNDRTQEVAIEREIDGMVAAAAAGDFSNHLKTEGKQGFFLNLGNGLNNLVSTVEVALNDIVRMLGAMAKGDLSERITRDYRGAFGQLKDDANETADRLTEVIAKIRVAANSIATSADEIAQGNADLSQRTEEQASSLEETAASMEEMTSTVKQSADNADRANAMSVEAQKLAREGGQVVEKAVAAMSEINSSSKRISDIISVIDEIAFQTNLLALNAAVEAARAGEQGRGFAVVAGEVRNLAQRSAGAAKEIKDLIRDSSGKVEDGTALVNRSGSVLQEIMASVDKVSVVMAEIADAAKEQSSGIEQVNTAVTQMDEMTQQNAALVEQASAAGQAMSDQARAMNQVVEFFSNLHTDLDLSSGSRPKASRSAQVASRPPVKTKLSRGKAVDNDEWEEF